MLKAVFGWILLALGGLMFVIGVKELIKPTSEEFKDRKMVAAALAIFAIIAAIGYAMTKSPPSDHPDVAAVADEVSRVDTIDGGHDIMADDQQNIDLEPALTTFPVVDPAEYGEGTAARAFALFLAAWHAEDYERMAQLTTASWFNSQADPVEHIRMLFDFKDLIGSEITAVRPTGSETVVDVDAVLTYTVGSVMNRVKVTVRVAKQAPTGVLSVDGRWGVNPLSVTRETELL